MAGAVELVGEEPVTERRVITMGIDQSVRQIGVGQGPQADRVRPPRAVRLGGEAQDPQVNRTGNPSAARSRTSGNIFLGGNPERTVTTSRLNSGGNFFGIATSFLQDLVPQNRCQPNLPQTRLLSVGSGFKSLAAHTCRFLGVHT